MPVDPFVQQMLPVPPMPDPLEDWDAYRAEGRAQLAALVGAVMQPAPDGVQTSRVDLPVEGGSIVLSVHRPVDQTGPLPGHLYLHGGGWVAGDGDSPAQDIICAERAVGAQCIVVAADYRKAPEHAFPTGLDDCLAALTWMVDHADDLGLDTDRISVGGGSAGANLAAALTLRVRDEGGPRLHFQLLEVPALDLTLSLPSHNDESLGTEYALAASDVRRLIDLYLQGADPTHPYASPLLADDLTGLPPAHIMSAEYDLLRDDGQRYAQRLNDAGVPATFTLGRGHVHLSPSFTAVMPSAREWRDEVIHTLTAANARRPA